MNESNKIVLVCNKCFSRNYRSRIKVSAKRFVIKKFCSFCNSHTLHKESY